MGQVSPIPPGQDRVIPHLVLSDANAALAFYAKAFGATEHFRMPAPDGKIMHAEFSIGGSVYYCCDEFPEWGGAPRNPKALGGSSVTLHHYVPDVDATIARALQAGASAKMPVQDMFWGDRYGSVADPFGHEWAFATHIKDLTPEEMAKAAAQAMAGGA